MKLAALKIALCLAIGALGGFVLASAYLAQGDAPRSRELNAVLSQP